jgi:hypothetical protein
MEPSALSPICNRRMHPIALLTGVPLITARTTTQLYKHYILLLRSRNVCRKKDTTRKYGCWKLCFLRPILVMSTYLSTIRPGCEIAIAKQNIRRQTYKTYIEHSTLHTPGNGGDDGGNTYIKRKEARGTSGGERPDAMHAALLTLSSIYMISYVDHAYIYSRVQVVKKKLSTYHTCVEHV